MGRLTSATNMFLSAKDAAVNVIKVDDSKHVSINSLGSVHNFVNSHQFYGVSYLVKFYITCFKE